MRGLIARRFWLLFALAFFLLIGRLPETRFSLESTRAAAPIAQNDTYNAVKGVNLVVSAPGILANDTDPDVGDTLTVDSISVLEQPPLISSLSPSQDGSFQYFSEAI